MNPKWVSAFGLTVLLHTVCVLLLKVHVTYKIDSLVNTLPVVWVQSLKELPELTRPNPLEQAKIIVEAMLDTETDD